MAKLKLPKFIKRIIRPEEEINQIVKTRLQEELKKAGAKDVMAMRPEYLQFRDGAVQKKYPASISYSTLREFANIYPVARACIERRKSQITQLDWKVAPVEMTNENITNEDNIKVSKEIEKKFKKPVGSKQRTNFSDWVKKILEDLLVIDAVAIYRRRNRKGDIIGYLPVDAATIELLLEKDGTTPTPPRPAYQQTIHYGRGLSTVSLGANDTSRKPIKLTTDELIYMMLNPSTYTPYGFAPLETLIITVTTALKLQAFNLGYLTEGNVPEGFVTLPKEIASSRDQLKEWQDAWDAMLSGHPGFQRKLKFLPEGMEYKPTTTPEDMTFERFEKWLAINTCSVFGVSPTAIGLSFENTRFHEKAAFEAGKERGLFSTALFMKSLMDSIIQDDMGYEDMGFYWTNINPTNRLEEIKVVDSLINSGLMSIDEWRIGEGLKPTGAKDPFIMTPIGPIFVKDLAAQSEAGQMPILPYKPPQQAAGASQTAGNALAEPNVPNPPKKIENEEMIKELKRWRKAAINDWKNNKEPRDFKSDIIDYRTKKMIQKGLEKAINKSQIERVFAPYIHSEYQTIQSLTKLYDEIDTIVVTEKRKQPAKAQAVTN